VLFATLANSIGGSEIGVVATIVGGALFGGCLQWASDDRTDRRAQAEEEFRSSQKPSAAVSTPHVNRIAAFEKEMILCN
jgi:hypothetical protein